ncbi:MAG: prepilin-type N-terminal cleavage/methylation domain-containing protein [Candidatus Dependentiae bacterium]|nr:prepilin-type N-terminal cleavage/methylation domain-containing protein [Candidatus Dependentiae bacterium]
MIPLQSRSGFTFIEIIIALALLTIVGTSLFMMQSTIFQNLTKSHNSVSNLLELDKEMIDFKLAISQAVQEKKSVADVKVHKEKDNPDVKLDIVIKPIAQSSQLYKNFSKNVFMVQASAQRDQQQDQWFSFLYIPPKKEKEEAPSAKVPKGVA